MEEFFVEEAAPVKQVGWAGVGTQCPERAVVVAIFKPNTPRLQLSSPCSLPGSKGDRVTQRHARCGSEQPETLDEGVLVFIGRVLKSFLSC